MSLSDRFRQCQWFDYERDAHGKVVASLGTVPEHRRGDVAYQIAPIVRSLGGEPAVTDFVYWSRESIE